MSHCHIAMAGNNSFSPPSLSSLELSLLLDHGERLISSALDIAPMPYHMVVVDSGSVGGGRSILIGAECVWRTIKAMLAGESLSFTYNIICQAYIFSSYLCVCERESDQSARYISSASYIYHILHGE